MPVDGPVVGTDITDVTRDAAFKACILTKVTTCLANSPPQFLNEVIFEFTGVGCSDV